MSSFIEIEVIGRGQPEKVSIFLNPLAIESLQPITEWKREKDNLSPDIKTLVYMRKRGCYSSTNSIEEIASQIKLVVGGPFKLIPFKAIGRSRSLDTIYANPFNLECIKLLETEPDLALRVENKDGKTVVYLADGTGAYVTTQTIDEINDLLAS